MISARLRNPGYGLVFFRGTSPAEAMANVAWRVYPQGGARGSASLRSGAAARYDQTR